MSARAASPLVIVAKSRWEPAIRREHALAAAAADAGHPVVFVESPSDVRAARGARRGAWAAGLHRPGVRRPRPGVTVVTRSTVVPGHRHPAAGALETRLLRRVLAAVVPAGAAVVCQVPWDWPAVAALAGHRRVYDGADDWVALLPDDRAERMRRLLAAIAAEADAVTVVSPDLVADFDGRPVTVVPNGVDAALLQHPPVDPPGGRRLVHVGTYSERFDTGLVARLLARLDGWRLDLYGPCQYAGRGDRPGAELAALLARSPGRVAWHGPVARPDVAGLLDGADVGIIPNRPERSHGQSSMKLLDLCARGRPAVASVGVWPPGAGAPPPGYREAGSLDEWVDAVTAAAGEGPGPAAERVAWAAERTWARCWPAWATAVWGTDTVGSDP